MPFTATPSGEPPIVTLLGDADRAEVWAGNGFNCLRWQTLINDEWRDLLEVAPDWDANPVPTRNGHPILFPFPNRLRGGKFHFAGRDYQLPLTESSGKHAIHGFAPRTRWRVVDTDAGPESASVAGELQLSKDVPGGLDIWPADFILRITYTLSAGRLAVDAEVTNPDAKPLPFGLGYHPYFKLPDRPDLTADGMTLRADTSELWVAEDGIATGELAPIPSGSDFRAASIVGSRVLDQLTKRTDGAAGFLADISSPGGGKLTVEAGGDFRELLLFTPPHRRAVAIEPYTCTSDAANLWSRGVDAGWRVLEPGGVWRGSVRYGWAARSVASGANAN